jgi:hypothetical protein
MQVARCARRDAHEKELLTEADRLREAADVAPLTRDLVPGGVARGRSVLVLVVAGRVVDRRSLGDGVVGRGGLDGVRASLRAELDVVGLRGSLVVVVTLGLRRRRGASLLVDLEGTSAKRRSAQIVGGDPRSD